MGNESGDQIPPLEQEKPAGVGDSDGSKNAQDAAPGNGDAIWYFIDQQRQHDGPHSSKVIESMWRAGKIHAATLVWKPGAPKWLPLSNCADQAASKPFVLLGPPRETPFLVGFAKFIAVLFVVACILLLLLVGACFLGL